MHNIVKKIGKYSLFVCIFSVACRSVPEAEPTGELEALPPGVTYAEILEEPEKVEPAVEFRKGEWVNYQHPLPSYQPIYLVTPENQKTLAYHGWDLNLDGQLDMFEGVNLKGQKYIELFDYDFDGSIDEVKRISLNEAAPEKLETLEVE